jgi:hypothetical protein
MQGVVEFQREGVGFEIILVLDVQRCGRVIGIQMQARVVGEDV